MVRRMWKRPWPSKPMEEMEKSAVSGLFWGVWPAFSTTSPSAVVSVSSLWPEAGGRNRAS